MILAAVMAERRVLEQRRDEFIAIASHELKTPLTSLKAYAEFLQRKFAKAGDEKSAKELLKMDAQINKLTSLIPDLLDVTRIEGEKLQFQETHFSLDELVEEIIEEMQRTTDTHMILKEEGFAKQTVYGDKERIGQVITNFLSNAIKYAPHSQKICVKTSATKQRVTLSVQAFGPGIAREIQPHIFERFYRAANAT